MNLFILTGWQNWLIWFVLKKVNFDSICLGVIPPPQKKSWGGGGINFSFFSNQKYFHLNDKKKTEPVGLLLSTFYYNLKAHNFENDPEFLG